MKIFRSRKVLPGIGPPLARSAADGALPESAERRRIVLSPAHRDALYHETLTDLSEIDDLRLEYESDDPDVEKCERIGRRAIDALRLIQEGGLGWGYHDPGDSAAIELTLPVEDLRRVILRKRANLASLREMRQREREGGDWEWEQLEKAREACASILHQIETDS